MDLFKFYPTNHRLTSLKGRGGNAAPPPFQRKKIGQLRIFGHQEKFGQNQFLRKFACVCVFFFFRGKIFSNLFLTCFMSMYDSFICTNIVPLYVGLW